MAALDFYCYTLDGEKFHENITITATRWTSTGNWLSVKSGKAELSPGYDIWLKDDLGVMQAMLVHLPDGTHWESLLVPTQGITFKAYYGGYVGNGEWRLIGHSP
ncbi:MAG: hypothetical protein IPM06_02440 [Rhizobiales bacterium]|nr:hypothetical protein [Hyphomicrobiales bacterium]